MNLDLVLIFTVCGCIMIYSAYMCLKAWLASKEIDQREQDMKISIKLANAGLLETVVFKSEDKIFARAAIEWDVIIRTI